MNNFINDFENLKQFRRWWVETPIAQKKFQIKINKEVGGNAHHLYPFRSIYET